MNSDHFTSKSFGKLQEIELKGIGKDFSFIPDPLPLSLDVDEKLMINLLEAKNALRSVEKLLNYENNYIFIKHLLNREAILSSRIEGNNASIEDLLIHEISPNKVVDPITEVSNYTKALLEGEDYLKDKIIDLNLIKKIHGIIMAGRKYANPGLFRSELVFIGKDRRFIPPPPNMVLDLLERLALDINKEHSIDPLIFSFMVHHHFESIHPFDGNGRVGRILLSLMIYKNCSLKMPFIHLSPFFESLKPLYMKGLFLTSINGNWQEWINFCLSGVIFQCKDTINRYEEIIKIKEVYERAITEKELLEVVLKIMFKKPFFSVKKIRDTLDVSISTANGFIKQLEDIGVVKFAKYKGKTEFYYAPHIFEALYGAE